MGSRDATFEGTLSYLKQHGMPPSWSARLDAGPVGHRVARSAARTGDGPPRGPRLPSPRNAVASTKHPDVHHRGPRTGRICDLTGAPLLYRHMSFDMELPL